MSPRIAGLMLLAGVTGFAGDARPECLARVAPPAILEKAVATGATGSATVHYLVSHKGVVTVKASEGPRQLTQALSASAGNVELNPKYCGRSFSARFHFDFQGSARAPLLIKFTEPDLYTVSLAPSDEVPLCLAQLPEPVFPLEAKRLRIPGDVRLRFTVDEAGVAHAVTMEGHALLVEPLRGFAEKVRFDARHCGGRAFEVLYHFDFEPWETHPTVTRTVFHLPNQYVLTTPEMANLGAIR